MQSINPAALGAVPMLAHAPRSYQIPGWDTWTHPQRLVWLRRLVEQAGMNPQVKIATIGILREAGVDQRQYAEQAQVLLDWVQRNIYYANESGEVIQDPLFTLQHRYGDCLPEDTLLLTDKHELVPICHIKPGMRIWGRDRWSVIENVWEKPEPLEVWSVKLNNGSTIRATPDHKLFVDACKRHGPHCRSRAYTCTEREIVRLKVSEIEEDDILLQPENIAFGEEDADPRVTYVEGLYVSDGWVGWSGSPEESTPGRFSISGKDGHPKEEQKKEVAAICDELGIPYRMHPRYIAVNCRPWAERLAAEYGGHAVDKKIPEISLMKHAAAGLLRGLLADSGANTHGHGRTFTSTSKTLFLQARVLLRMFGQDCSEAYVPNHGGLGENPVWRLCIRGNAGRKKLRVTSVVEGGPKERCFDITTDDHFVYLPEADVTVSNCDDAIILLMSMYDAMGMPWKFTIAGKNISGKVVRWVEGDAMPWGVVEWGHIYGVVGYPPTNPSTWKFVEPTLRGAPLGWDVAGQRTATGTAIGNAVRGILGYGAGASVEPGAGSGSGSGASGGTPDFLSRETAKQIAIWTVAGICSAVAGKIALDLYEHSKKRYLARKR